MTAPAANRFTSVGKLLLAGGVAVAIFGLLYLLLTPKLYHSTARIQVEKRDWVHEKADAGAQNPYDPQLAPSECQVLRSNAFLDRAIEHLDLTREWGKRYNQGVKLTEEAARERLRSKADIHPMPNSSVIAVTVTSEDRAETAKIANEFANLYINYRQGRRQDSIHERINSLQQRWDEQSKKIAEAQAKVDELALQIRRAQGSNTTLMDADSFKMLQVKRADLDKQATQLRDQLTELKSFTPAELRRALSSDSETNSLLNTTLVQLKKAEVQLADVKAGHGPDSPEFKHATMSVDELDRRVTQQAKSALAMKEFNLTAAQAAVEAVDEKLKNARPVTALDTNLLKTSGYEQALSDLKTLKSQRDELEAQMNASPQDDVMPVVITAQLTDPAEVSSHPFSPDSNIAMGTMLGGGLLAVLGCGVCSLGLRKKVAALKPGSLAI